MPKEAIGLGFEVPDYGDLCCGPGDSNKEQKKKTVYPEFSIRDNTALVKALKGKVGEEFTALVRLRVTSVEIREVERMESKPSYHDSSGASADIEVLAITPQDISLPSGEDSEKSAVDALNEYSSGKK